METVVATVPGARRIEFATPNLPPLPSLVPLLAAAEAARDDGDGSEIEALALSLAGAVASTLAGARKPGPAQRDERRISKALQRIEAQAHQQLTLGDLAREAGTPAPRGTGRGAGRELRGACLSC